VGVGVENRGLECIIRHCVPAVQVAGQERQSII
jgi:hypothetical protein